MEQNLREEMQRLVEALKLAAEYLGDGEEDLARITVANALASHRLDFTGEGVGGEAEGFFGEV